MFTWCISSIWTHFPFSSYKRELIRKLSVSKTGYYSQPQEPWIFYYWHFCLAITTSVMMIWSDYIWSLNCGSSIDKFPRKTGKNKPLVFVNLFVFIIMRQFRSVKLISHCLLIRLQTIRLYKNKKPLPSTATTHFFYKNHVFSARLNDS